MSIDAGWIRRSELMEQLGMSDSTERRHRLSTDDWPPSVTVGKKIFYRKSQVDAWAARREAASSVQTGSTRALDVNCGEVEA